MLHRLHFIYLLHSCHKSFSLQKLFQFLERDVHSLLCYNTLVQFQGADNTAIKTLIIHLSINFTMVHLARPIAVYLGVYPIGIQASFDTVAGALYPSTTIYILTT